MVTTAMVLSPSEKVVRLSFKSHVRVFIPHPGTVPAPHPVRGTVAELALSGARSQPGKLPVQHYPPPPAIPNLNCAFLWIARFRKPRYPQIALRAFSARRGRAGIAGMRLSTILRSTTALFLLTATPAAAWVDPAAGTPQSRGVSRAADIPEQNWKPGHRGVDLPLPIGHPVLAAGDGVVAFVGSVAGTPVLAIDHPGGIRTTYQPVRSDLAVGDAVREGQPVGTLTRAPTSFSGSHDGLHWGALMGKDSYIDPLTLLEPPQIRLKPVDGSATRADAPGRRRV